MFPTWKLTLHGLFILPDVEKDSLLIDEETEPKLLYFSTDSVFGELFKARVYPLILPVIPANTTNEFETKIKTPETI